MQEVVRGVKCFSGGAILSLVGPAVSTLLTFRPNGMNVSRFYLSLAYSIHRQRPEPLIPLFFCVRQVSVSTETDPKKRRP